MDFLKDALDPKHIDKLSGCKRSENIDAFSDRTAGTIFLCYPCGIVVAWDEMYRAESVVHVALLILSVFGHDDFARSRKPRFVGYDRACDLDPCIRNMLDRGALPQSCATFFEGIEFVVDRFHISGHKEDCCVISSDKCKFHPDLPKFDDIRNANTEICEQTFRWFNLLKANTRVMEMSHFWWYVNTLVDERNERREQQLEREGKFEVARDVDISAPGQDNIETDKEDRAYEVKKIVGKRINVDNGNVDFEVKWKGYVNASIEPSENLKNCEFEVEKFEKKFLRNPQLCTIIDPKLSDK